MMSISIQDEISTNEKEKRTVKKSFINLYYYCVNSFDDREENLKWWLKEQPCVFISPRNGKMLSVEVRKDAEAIYYFLLFCRKLNRHEEVNDDFADYLSYLLSVCDDCEC